MENEPLSPEAIQASKEVVKTAAIHADAVEVSRVAQLQAHDEKTRELFEQAISNAFGEYKDQQRFIDLKRVPLICAQIVNIHDNLAEIKEMMQQVKLDLDEKDKRNEERYVNRDQFDPVQKIVYGVVALILTAVVGALIALVLMK